MRCLAAVWLACGFAVPALATEWRYACRSFEANPPADLAFVVEHRDGTSRIAQAGFQIAGDLGYSTDAAEPTSRATLTDVTIKAGDVGFRFHYRDASYDGTVGEVRVVTLSEGETSRTAGVLHAVGGGLYPIVCSVDYGLPNR